MGAPKCRLGHLQRYLGHDGGAQQRVWGQRGALIVEDFNHRYGVDAVVGNHGHDFTRGNALRRPSRSSHRPPFWLAYCRGFLAHRAVADDNTTAALFIHLALSLRPKPERSQMAMEYTGRGG